MDDGIGNCCLMGIGLHVCNMENFWRWGLHTDRVNLTLLNCTINNSYYGSQKRNVDSGCTESERSTEIKVRVSGESS